MANSKIQKLIPAICYFSEKINHKNNKQNEGRCEKNESEAIMRQLKLVKNIFHLFVYSQKLLEKD